MEVRVSYWNEYVTEVMRVEIAELAVRHFKNEGSDKHGISSITSQRVFVRAEGADVEEVARSGGGLVQEKAGEILKPEMVVETDDEG